jgi:hypothetical protein
MRDRQRSESSLKALAIVSGVNRGANFFHFTDERWDKKGGRIGVDFFGVGWNYHLYFDY